MIYFEIKNELGEVIASNMDAFPHGELFRDNKDLTLRSRGLKSVYEERDKIAIWLVVQDQKDLLNSNKLFNKTMDVYANLAEDFFEYYTSRIRTHSHTLRSIQGKMKQKIDGLASKQDFQGKNYNESKQKISEKVRQNIDRTADTICYLNKRVAEIDAHIEGFDVLYMGHKRDVDLQRANIRKVILNILAPFLAEFEKKGVAVDVVIADKYAEENKIQLEYKLFNLALVNLFDNAVKYARPRSKMKIVFEKSGDAFEIDFAMESIAIDEDEQELLFEEGYTGRHAKDSAGDGIGMSVIKKALRLNDMELVVFPGKGHKYASNLFRIQSI